jgi:hypothetical protein
LACPSERFSGQDRNGEFWFNWAELAGGRVEAFREPATLADIVRAVHEAEAARKRIRVVGSGWAFEDIAYSPEVMLSLVRLNAVLDYVTDPDRGALLQGDVRGRTLVHVEAGMKVATLNLQLAARNLAMPTLGGSNGQSIVGALTTSTHGGDFAEPPFCDLIHAVHLVGPGGQEFWIERESASITTSNRLGHVLPCPDTLIVRDDELFDAVAVSLGRFGIIYSVILEAVPAFLLARERVTQPFPVVMSRLRQGIDQGTILEPLLAILPPPAAALGALSTRPRGMDLLIDTRNPQQFHIVRRWVANGPDIAMAPTTNLMCSLGAAGVLGVGAGLITTFGMNPAFLNTPLLLLDPTRLPRLTEKQFELLARISEHRRPGEALGLVASAYSEFGITRLPDLLQFIAYENQFPPQRGASYAVMTGGPTYDISGTQLPHELHWCYRANSCEITFDAADGRYIDFVNALAANAPGFVQAGYISLRFSRRSRALLSMHNVSSALALSIEVSAIKGFSQSAAWIEFVLSEGLARGGRPHWGQQNRLTPAQVRQLYPVGLDRWRAALAGLSGSSTLFSSAFTVARGLEPQGTRATRFEGTAAELASSAVNAACLLLDEDEF